MIEHELQHLRGHFIADIDPHLRITFSKLPQYLETTLPTSRLQRDLTDSSTLRNIGSRLDMQSWPSTPCCMA